jgi:RHS repeat-associated protein
LKVNKRSHTLSFLVTFCLVISIVTGFSATFPGNADLTVSDPAGSLSWNSAANALTVQCWFKISIPSGTNLTSNMAILVNNTSGPDGNPQAFLFRFNIYNGNVEFVTQGNLSGYTNTLIQDPYLDRWYHLAVVRQGSAFTGYVDGLQVFVGTANVGDSSTTAGVSVGGWGQGDYLYGEVQEVSIYQNALAQDFIAQYMYNSQPTNDPDLDLTGYYPVGFSTNGTSSLANLAPGGSAASASILGAGTVIFPETDQAGEQSAFDAWRNGGRNSIVPLSGAFTWQQSILSRPTPGIAFDLRIEYSSANSSSGAFLGSISPYAQGILGTGWRHSFQTALIPSQDFAPEENTDVVGLMRWDGSIETWNLDYTTGEYVTRDGEYNGELAQGITNWTWTTPDRLVYSFFPPDSGPNYVMYGRLISIRDFNGNSVQMRWNQTSGVLTQIVDSVSGTFNFNYHAGLLTNISFNSWSVNFAYNSTNQLISKTITNSSGLYGGVNTNIWQFAYGTNGLLSQIIDPRGITNALVQYDQYGRMTNQMDALGRATATIYGGPGQFQITHIDPATNSWVETYDRKGNILSQSDPLGDTTSYAYDTNDNRISVTEPLGWTTYFGFDNRANVIAKTNALGETTLWTIHPHFNKPIQKITPQPPDANGWTSWTNYYAYDAAGNLTNNYDALGTLAGYIYLANGLVSSSTDGNGHTTSFGYDTNGFLNSRTDPATNTTHYILNDLGWKFIETDALIHSTTNTYDLNGKVISIQDALGRTFTRTYDANGNLLSQSDGKGQLTTFAYDTANQKTNMIDRTRTNVWNYFYTLRGKLDHVSDPLGHSVTNTYDAANRLIAVTDPLGHSVTNQYDANGNLIIFFDKLGRRWVKMFDRLNRVTTESDPLGNTKTTIYDVADRIQQIISPNGYPSVDSYDGRGRLVKWVDPQNSQWLYAYDGVDNITNIMDALGGHYVMAYGSRNERILEQNQDGLKWQYSYDALTRLQQQTDPDGIVRTPTYDAANRVLFVNFSTGRQDSFNYDTNDNPLTISRSVSGLSTSTQFTYDPLDRVITQSDALGQTVLYGYDPLSRVTTITYPGNKMLTNSYDGLGRLMSQSDWAGRQTSYIYDFADRLIRRAYPNGVIQTNMFDTSGRIASLSFAPTTRTSNSINIALTYAYDRNGNKTGGGEIGTFNWPLPSLTADQSAFTPAGRLISRQITESSPSNSVNAIAYHYDSSGNMTNAVGDGQTWTLTYDEDNRTSSINWDCGLTTKFVTNRYDALGRRISKIANGVTTGYVLSLAGGTEKVLCDLDGNSNVTAWYIHGPDLCYRVDSTNGLLCYHADAQANIISLSDGKTNLVGQYAYTPYGRSLGSTNSQSQTSNPYLFVGSQGVQEESDIPNLYFMRARYYSADAGLFLSTDPVKKIGAGWKPTLFTYAQSAPTDLIDSTGEEWEFPWSGATLGADATLFAGRSIESDLNPTSPDLGYSVHKTRGVSLEAGGTVPVLGYSQGNDSDWASYNEYDISIALLGDFSVSIAHSQNGDWKGEISAGAGAGFALTQTQVRPSDPGYEGTPLESFFESTLAPTTAVAHANQNNVVQSTQPAATGNHVGTTSSGGGGSGGSTSYVVRPGDTLGNIGYANGTTATAIGAANGIQNLNLIYPGQVLTIPHP